MPGQIFWIFGTSKRELIETEFQTLSTMMADTSQYIAVERMHSIHI